MERVEVDSAHLLHPQLHKALVSVNGEGGEEEPGADAAGEELPRVRYVFVCMHAVLEDRGRLEAADPPLRGLADRLEAAQGGLLHLHLALNGLGELLVEETLVTAPLQHNPQTSLLEGEVEEIFNGIFEFPLAVYAQGTVDSLYKQKLVYCKKW